MKLKAKLKKYRAQAGFAKLQDELEGTIDQKNP